MTEGARILIGTISFGVVFIVCILMLFEAIWGGPSKRKSGE